jgi:hypothetical protein
MGLKSREECRERLEREILPEKKPRKVWQNDMKEWVIMLE